MLLRHRSIGARLGQFTLALATIGLLAPVGTANAASGDNDELNKLLDEQSKNGLLGGWADRASERPRTFPFVEHHGYFRFRADFFYNGHLNTVIPGDAASGTSGLPAPLTENVVNNDASGVQAGVGTQDAKTLSGANIRLRYQPTIHVSESLRIRTTIDMLDNLVLGSTPDFSGDLARPDAPLSVFNAGSVSPSAGVNNAWDAVRVKEAYAEFQPAFLLRLGRMASDWGLGIVANSGKELDDDYGDYVDRALVMLKLYDVYIGLAWDYPYSGAIYDDPSRFNGQPTDLGTADDVNQWVLTLFQRPLSDVEKAERRVDLYEKFKPQFDWGVYGIYRQQSFDLDTASYSEWRENGGVGSYDDLGLVERGAWAVIPDLWLRYEQRFNFHSGIRVELEAAAIIGHIDNRKGSLGETDPRDIRQFGGALEFDYNWHTLNVGIMTGAATGDDTGCFGVLDCHQIASPDGTPNKEITAFKFDRDYKIDLLLFREVIGTVTNTFYAKPYIAYDLFDSPEDTLGFRLDLLTAWALDPAGTPGGDSFLGFETDAKMYFYNKAGFRFDLEAGFLFPGAALNYRPADNANNRDAEFAFTLQGRFGIVF